MAIIRSKRVRDSVLGSLSFVKRSEHSIAVGFFVLLFFVEEAVSAFTVGGNWR